MIFYILADGRGTCCDYGIGRNKDFQKLKAKTWAEAQEEAWQYLKDRGFDELELLSASQIRARAAEHRVETLTILEVALEEKFDVDEKLYPYIRDARERDAAESKAADEAEFERLKAKLGK